MQLGYSLLIVSYSHATLLLCPCSYHGQTCREDLGVVACVAFTGAFGCQNTDCLGQRLESPYAVQHTWTGLQLMQILSAYQQKSGTISSDWGLYAVRVAVCVLSVQAAQHVPFHFSFCRSTSLASSFFTLAVHLQLFVWLSQAQFFALVELCSEKLAVTWPDRVMCSAGEMDGVSNNFTEVFTLKSVILACLPFVGYRVIISN